MDKKSRLWSILSYITWIGWIIAFVKHDKDDKLVRRHLNQALVLNIIETVGGAIAKWGGLFAIVGEVIDIAALVLFIMGIARAAKMSDEPLPIIGEINLLS
ncbi:MAG: hypothetical protein IKO07_12740 [Clostridia bacterium]|nr:hypothetical protein [Clostridia bacterium]